MRQQSAPQGFPALYAAHHQPHGTEQEIRARAAGDTKRLLTIDGYVVTQHTEAEAEAHHVQAYKPSAQQEKPVP